MRPRPSRATRATPRLVRVFAVDDHPAFLRSVESVIAATAGFELVGTATTGAAALEAVGARDDIDLVLLDVHLPDLTGIEVARRAEHRRAAIVLMSTSDPSDVADLDCRVAGFLAKEHLTTGSLRALWDEASS